MGIGPKAPKSALYCAATNDQQIRAEFADSAHDTLNISGVFQNFELGIDPRR